MIKKMLLVLVGLSAFVIIFMAFVALNNKKPATVPTTEVAQVADGGTNAVVGTNDGYTVVTHGFGYEISTRSQETAPDAEK